MTPTTETLREALEDIAALCVHADSYRLQHFAKKVAAKCAVALASPSIEGQAGREAIIALLREIDLTVGTPNYGQIADAILALGPPVTPHDGCGPEAIAWIVLSTDADQIRVWWRDKEPAVTWAARHDRPLIPLYAKPFAVADFLALAPPAPDRAADPDQRCLDDMRLASNVRAAVIRECAADRAAVIEGDTLTDALIRIIDGWRATHPDLTYFETVTVIEGIGRTLHNLRADAAVSGNDRSPKEGK